jgi:hypothetical protein
MTTHPSSPLPPGESAVSTQPAEWVPLDEVAETWADFSLRMPNAHALQAVGNAFLALSFEMSAHTHYTRVYHGIWRRSPATVAQGIAEAITDLREACQQWVSAYQWLERSANEERHDEEHLSVIRQVFESIAAQQLRLCLLLSRVQEEERAVQEKSAKEGERHATW